jgi:ATP synthase protein I
MFLGQGESKAHNAYMLRSASMGWTLVCEIVAGILIGMGVDWLVGTDRIFLLVGALAGLVVGMTSFIRAAMKENRRLEREQKRRS